MYRGTETPCTRLLMGSTPIFSTMGIERDIERLERQVSEIEDRLNYRFVDAIENLADAINELGCSKDDLCIHGEIRCQLHKLALSARNVGKK